MALDFMDDSLSGSNHKSIGTRFGLKFDPMKYFLDLFGKGDEYANFINKTGDTANKVMSKAAEPMFSLSRKYTPGRKDGNWLDKGLTWAENKPASVTGLIIGGEAAGGALSGGGAGAESGAAAAGTGGSTAGLGSTVGEAAGGTFGGGSIAAAQGGGASAAAPTAGSAAPAAAQGFDWQGALGKAGGGMQQQAQQEDEMATRLAMMGPPPGMQGGGIQLQNTAPQQYAEALKRAPTSDKKTPGEAQTSQGLVF